MKYWDTFYQCVAKGVSVFHEDIDNGLPEYGDTSFDYVILNQSLQQVKKPEPVCTDGDFPHCGGRRHSK
jgi:hypothetical protein